MGYNGYTEKRKVANARYHEKQEFFQVRLNAGQKDRIVECAKLSGVSLNQFVVDAIEERLKKEGK